MPAAPAGSALFAETAVNRGCLTITLGGGDRKRWRSVAPHGGRQRLLPDQPLCTVPAAPDAMRAATEEILSEVRACPPLLEGVRVDVPSERERTRAAAVADTVSLPAQIWKCIDALADSVEWQG